MEETLSMMSLRKVFRFPFREADWLNRFLIGALLSLASYVVPIVPGIFVTGYVLRVMRQTIAGEEPTLPAWEDWDQLAKDGLSILAVSIVYFLPALVTIFGGMALYFAGNFFAPLAAATSDAPPETILGQMFLFTFGSMALLLVTNLVGLFFSLLGALALPPALGHFIAQGELRAAFRVRQWWAILKADKGGYFIVWVLMAGLLSFLYLAAIMAYFTCVLCCLLPFLMAPVSLYVALIGAALFGQTYREGAARVQALAEI